MTVWPVAGLPIGLLLPNFVAFLQLLLEPFPSEISMTRKLVLYSNFLYANRVKRHLLLCFFKALQHIVLVLRQQNNFNSVSFGTALEV